MLGVLKVFPICVSPQRTPTPENQKPIEEVKIGNIQLSQWSQFQRCRNYLCMIVFGLIRDMNRGKFPGRAYAREICFVAGKVGERESTGRERGGYIWIMRGGRQFRKSINNLPVGVHGYVG